MTNAPEWATDALRASCSIARLDFTSGTFVRVGTYATWRFDEAGVIARVASSDDHDLVVREYELASAIDAANVPVALPAREWFVHDCGTVGWWNLGTPIEASFRMLGTIARVLHDNSAAWLSSGAGRVRRCDLAGQTRVRLTRAYSTLPDMRTELDSALALVEDLSSGGQALRPASIAIVHGDLSPQNVLADGSLIDLETAGLGDPAIDLARIVSAVERFGAPLSALDEFASGYGCRITDFARPGVQYWLRVRDLWAAAWAAACADRDPTIAAEARHRLRTIHDPTAQWALL
ncbi:MAG: phosphotransferase family protein [Acidimicrobiia bacterium]